MRKIVFNVGDSDNYKDVLSVLKANNVSRRLLVKLKQADNGITKNGLHARTIDSVKAGDKIEIRLSDDKMLVKNYNLNVPVMYEDDDIVIFDKPPFMPVHPSHKHLKDTLGNYFASRYDGISFRPVNRLDRDTSGLCAVAKNQFMAASLQKNLEKTYFAVCEGLIVGNGTINEPIARLDQSIIKRYVNDSGQQAVTHYTAINSTPLYTLLRIKLETGRTHQIRVHFAYKGHPLAGDNMYGGSLKNINRHALHCGELIFHHPFLNKVIQVSSSLPSDMQVLISGNYYDGI